MSRANGLRTESTKKKEYLPRITLIYILLHRSGLRRDKANLMLRKYIALF